MANRFAALDVDDDEPVKVTATKERKQKAAPPAPAPAPPAPVVARATSDDSEAVRGDDRARRGGAPRGRGGRGAAREGWSGRGREYERHSGTGRGKEISKDGAGARNWGSTGDVVKQGDAPDASAAPETAEGEAAAAPETEAPAPPPEPEEVVLTLEDVEKARQAKRSGELFATQKEDTSKLLVQFTGAKKVDRNELDEEDAFLSGKLYGNKAESADEEAAKAADNSLAELLAFNYGGRGPRADGGGEIADRGDRGERGGRGRGGFRGGRGGHDGDRPDRPDRPPRDAGEGGRGGRGGFRGRGGRGGGDFRGGRGGGRGGGPSGPRGPSVSVNVNDTAAFPSL